MYNTSLGVPRPEILRVSQLLATKLVENEFAAYLGTSASALRAPLSFHHRHSYVSRTELQAIQAGSNPLTDRAFTITSYALCGFANLSSLGIQIGVLTALAPTRSKIIARSAMSAMICGFFSTLQTAGIA